MLPASNESEVEKRGQMAKGGGSRERRGARQAGADGGDGAGAARRCEVLPEDRLPHASVEPCMEHMAAVKSTAGRP